MCELSPRERSRASRISPCPCPRAGRRRRGFVCVSRGMRGLRTPSAARAAYLRRRAAGTGRCESAPRCRCRARRRQPWIATTRSSSALRG